MGKRIVIIGGGFAGINLAKKLKNKKGFQVTLVDKNNCNFFSPLLYQVATGMLAEMRNNMPEQIYPELSGSELEIHLVDAAPTVLPSMREKSHKNDVELDNCLFYRDESLGMIMRPSEHSKSGDSVVLSKMET